MNDLLEDISKLTKKFGKPPSQRRIREAQEFLDLAHQDLTASRLLYDAQIFNLACYHIQQSVEKTTKAYHKLLGILKDKAIRGTGHDTPELFLRMIELPWAQKFAELAKKVSGTQVITDTSKAQSAIDSEVEKARIARLNPARINEMLGLIPQVKKKLAPFFPLTNRDLVMVILRLSLLSLVTFPHERYSRYPDEVVKPWEYTPELGLVASIANVWSEAEAAISGVQRLINSAKRRK
jgi:HEPN domain-containing protein